MQTLTPARRATTPSDSKVEQSWVPAPTEFSTTGSAVAPSSSAALSLARPRPSTSRFMPSASPSPPWLPACTTTRSTPRVPAAASSRARATMEKSRCSSFVEARFMRYFACATTGEMPKARLPSTKATASLRGLGSAQACGLETKIWIVSHPSPRAASRVLTSPPEVGRCRPTLFVLPGIAMILAARRGPRCERYNLSKPSKRSEGATGMAVEGKVAKILGNNEIVINRGRGQGVRQGMLFEIYAPKGTLVPAAVAEGRVWLLLTSMFLHSGFIHLALNMLSLYFLGSFVEQAFGRSRFLALYLSSGLAGGIAYLYFGAFDTPAVGASGAIFGLLGGVLGLSLRRGTFSWQNPLIRQLLILTALNLYFGFSVANISNTAHIGGLVGGAAFGWLVAPTVYSGKRLRAATPTFILLGTELILLALWLL